MICLLIILNYFNGIKKGNNSTVYIYRAYYYVKMYVFVIHISVYIYHKMRRVFITKAKKNYIIYKHVLIIIMYKVEHFTTYV